MDRVLRLLIPTLLPLLLLTPAGCDSAATNPGDGGEPPDQAMAAAPVDLGVPATLTLDEYLAAVPEATCRMRVACGTISASRLAQCIENVKKYEQPNRSQADGVRAGRLGYDAKAAADCIRGRRSGECPPDPTPFEIPTGLNLACFTIFQPLVDNGMACAGGQECREGYCAIKAPGCPGTCAAFHTVGEACGPPDFAVCDPRTSRCDQATLKCVAPVADGMPCDTPDACMQGSYCKGFQPSPDAGQPAVPGTCSPVASAAAGDPCSRNVFPSCGSGFYCSRFAAASPSCVAKPAEGQPCDETNACPPGIACIGLITSRDPRTLQDELTRKGVCSRRLDAGAPCDLSYTVDGCASDARCDRTTSTCRELDRVGAPCGQAVAFYCGQYTYCDATSVCAELVPIGDACTPLPAGTRGPCWASQCDATNHCSVPKPPCM